MGSASGIRIMGWCSKLLHGGEHGGNGVGVGHLLGHLLLPLSQKLRSPLLIILIFHPNVPQSLPKAFR